MNAATADTHAAIAHLHRARIQQANDRYHQAIAANTATADDSPLKASRRLAVETADTTRRAYQAAADQDALAATQDARRS